MKRQTLQKTIILDALKKLGNHPTPAMVYEEIHPKYPTISQATVFRVLAGECEEGTVQRVYAPGTTARYEYGNRPHWHICCRGCGRIADVSLALSENPLRLMQCDEDYTVEKYYIEFVGLCPACREKADEDKENNNEK